MQVTDVIPDCNFILNCAIKRKTGIFNVARPRVDFNSYNKNLTPIVGKKKKKTFNTCEVFKR